MTLTEVSQMRYYLANFASEWCRCDADMKRPWMGSTLLYVPFRVLIEVSQMRYYLANFASEWCRCDADMIKPPVGSTQCTSYWWL